MNPYKDLAQSSYSTVSLPTYEDVATKLLQDQYFLTALELHTELVENGTELPQLREFFSNPGNFEQHVTRATDHSSMHRTPSLATLDSLDTARYSEDGGGDRGGSGGDIAVLEFELRKARETINSLRANLTQFADGGSVLDKDSKDQFSQHTLKPHEKRALNFLINEYLLLQDYKLTSITFSDENPDQDFEDWDDVGLNISRPTGLASIFLGNVTSLKLPLCEVSTQTEILCTDFECQTELDETSICTSCQTSLEHETDWNHELLIQAEEIELLKGKIIALELEKLNFQKLYDAAIVSLNSLTSPGSEAKGLNLDMPDLRLQKSNEQYMEPQPLTCTATENYYGSSNSTHSATPEQFELIDNERTAGTLRKEGSNTSSFDPAIMGDGSVRGTPTRRGSAATLDDTLSINDGGEWTRLHFDCPVETNSKIMWIDSGLPNNLKVTLLNWCCGKSDSDEVKTNPVANESLVELITNDKPIDLQGLLTLVADTLPKLIPHTLVARRCEAVALLACTVHLLSSVCGPAGAVRRTRLLQLLLTLIKKPDANEARVIHEAARLIVKWGGSGEVLSCIAELIESRSSERRLLASQICLSVAPYVSIELCTSLLLSVMTLMCESNEVDIRVLGLKAACLICPVAEHKYGQLENLLFNFLKDPSEGLVRNAVNMYLPVLARVALIAGKFSSDLCSKTMMNLTKSSINKDWEKVLLYLDIMKVLVLAKLAYVIDVQIVKDIIQTNCDNESTIYQEIPLDSDCEYFLDVQCYISDGTVGSKLLVAVNKLLNDKPEARWSELNWFVDLLNTTLDIAVDNQYLNHASVYQLLITLFSNYVENFGTSFTLHIMKPVFLNIILDLEHKMEKLEPLDHEATLVVGIYLATVLLVSKDVKECSTFFQKWVVYSSIRSLPLRVLALPLKWIAKHKPVALSLYLRPLTDLAASSTEGASAVSVRVYIANLVTELLNTCTDGTRSQTLLLLQAVGTLMHDDDGSVRESAIGAWGSLTRSCMSSGAEGEARCWAALEGALAGPGAPFTAREAARTAESLSLLVLPNVDDTHHVVVSEKAVSVLCALCHAAPLTAESVSALAPGLRLAAHHARSHPALLPALRKIEEAVQSPALAQYKQSIEALIHNVTTPSSGPAGDAHCRDAHARPPTSNLLAAQEAVGRRVTQMFQNSKNNMNLHNIFKKKT